MVGVAAHARIWLYVGIMYQLYVHTSESTQRSAVPSYIGQYTEISCTFIHRRVHRDQLYLHTSESTQRSAVPSYIGGVHRDQLYVHISESTQRRFCGLDMKEIVVIVET